MNSVEASAFPITDYESVPVEELFARTRAAKKALGDRVLILGHNYQRDEVIVHADLRGDSLLLSKLAAERSQHPYVVFCGVHFMAETADILSRSNQTVILPDLAAGCSMADMAAIGAGGPVLGRTGASAVRGRGSHAGGVRELCRGPQSLLRGAWGHYLYVLQCQGRHGMVLGPERKNSVFPG